MLISVVTPTYNREKLLERCYKSLCNQNFKNFEWIVVDDGSLDDTRLIVESFKREKKINMRYIYQKNQGKHIAHNTGVLEAKGELFLCLDSDDYLFEDSLFKAAECWKKVNKKAIGIIAKRGDKYGHSLCSNFPQNVRYIKMFDLINYYNFSGDTALFFKTDILKEKMFPKFDNEKFLSETCLYFQLDEYGEMYLLDEILYCGEYQDDGLTSKYHKLMRENPIGATYCYYIGTLSSKRKIMIIKYYIFLFSYWNEKCRKYMNINPFMFCFYLIGKLYEKLKLSKL